MSDARQIHMKLEREDTPTRSIWQRYKFELLVRHAKLFWGIIISSVFLFFIGFPFVIFVMEMHWGFGFVGIFILLYWILKWVFLAIWFVVSRAGLALFFAPLIYVIIKYFIHVDRVGFRELGSKHIYFFKVTTTSDGYLLHEKRFFSNKPIYLDKVTVQYFKENGSERIFKEKGKKDKDFLELDIVPLSWRNDPLYITDEQTSKCFLNNAILVTEPIRDYYALVVKGFSPSDREAEKEIIYSEITRAAELRLEVLRLKRKVKDVDLDRIELIAPVLIPSPGDEVFRFAGVLDKSTKPFDKTIKTTESQTSLLEAMMQSKESMTDEELTNYVALGELD